MDYSNGPVVRDPEGASTAALRHFAPTLPTPARRRGCSRRRCRRRSGRGCKMSASASRRHGPLRGSTTGARVREDRSLWARADTALPRRTRGYGVGAVPGRVYDPSRAATSGFPRTRRARRSRTGWRLAVLARRDSL